jgi:hypothetical protein
MENNNLKWKITTVSSEENTPKNIEEESGTVFSRVLLAAWRTHSDAALLKISATGKLPNARN